MVIFFYIHIESFSNLLCKIRFVGTFIGAGNDVFAPLFIENLCCFVVINLHSISSSAIAKVSSLIL